jgi:hypothetical protein
VRNVSATEEELVNTYELYNHHYSGHMTGKGMAAAAWPEGQESPPAATSLTHRALYICLGILHRKYTGVRESDPAAGS